MDAQPSSAPKPFIHQRIRWPKSLSFRQNFDLPESIMYYMAKNPPTPEVYNKLIQSCKYFFEKNPILVAADLYDAKRICPKKDCPGYKKCCVEIDITKITSMLWFTHALYLDYCRIPNFSSILMSKIYHCDVQRLVFTRQRFMFDRFKLLASAAKDVELEGVRIKYMNRSTVMLEKVIEVIPNIEEFDFYFLDGHTMATAATVKNIANLKNLGNLKKFTLRNIPEILNIDDLSAFIKDRVDVKFHLVFDDTISDDNMDELDILIAAVIESGIPNRYIRYLGQDQAQLKIMNDRYQW